jgi:hypothetical protein
MVKAWGGEEQLRNSDKTKASAIAGTAAGAMGGLIRKLSRHFTQLVSTDRDIRGPLKYPPGHASLDSPGCWRTNGSESNVQSPAQGSGRER